MADRSARLALITIVRMLLFSCCLCSAVTPAHAQAVPIFPQRPHRNTPVGSLSISATPSLVTFQLVPHGIASGSTPVAITTSWNGGLCLFSCSVNVYAYFANANAALSGRSPLMEIPSSAVLGRVATGIPTSFTAFTQTTPLSGPSGLDLFSVSYFLFTFGGSRTDALNLEIDLSQLPQLPAGNFNGVLYIQAQSF